MDCAKSRCWRTVREAIQEVTCGKRRADYRATSWHGRHVRFGDGGSGTTSHRALMSRTRPPDYGNTWGRLGTCPVTRPQSLLLRPVALV